MIPLPLPWSALRRSQTTRMRLRPPRSYERPRPHPLGFPRPYPVSIECESCGRRGRYNIARLMEKYGDMKLPELRHVLADCPKAKSFSIRDQCKVRYGKDSRF